MSFESVAFVTVVSVIITTITAIYIALYLSLLRIQNLAAFWIIGPLFTVSFLLMLVSYFRAVCASPGHPSRNTNRQFSAAEIQRFKQLAQIHKSNKKQRRSRRPRFDADPEEIKEMKEITYCQRCQLVKYPRVHHCKICDACIVRMDHHCPWVGNCVGRNNHKYFILFLLYATIGLGIVWITIAVEAFSGWETVSKADSEIAQTLVGVAGVGSLILFLSIGGLLITQVWGASDNMTTLQTFIPGFDQRNPFETGSWHKNFQQIFGSDYWLLPVAPNLPPFDSSMSRHTSERDYKSPEVYGSPLLEGQ